MSGSASSATRALVTGSSSGIGAAVAARLLAEGWQVHGFDRDEASITNAHFHAHRVDLTDHATAAEAVARLLAEGQVSAFVHAAGVMRAAPLGHLRPEDGALLYAATKAALVAFLLGADAAAITGQDIAVCGGASLPR